MKDMSQWNNRFSVLDSLSNTISPSSEISDTDSITMSSKSPAVEALPQRIYIRSANPKTSTQIPAVLKTLDTEVRIPVTALLDSGATGLFLTKDLWSIITLILSNFLEPFLFTMLMEHSTKEALSKRKFN